MKCFAAAATAKSLQSCPTLCDPMDVSPPGSPAPGILQARTLEWVAISFSNAWKWKVTNVDSILKSRDITLSTKVHLVKSMVFPVVMYGCDHFSSVAQSCPTLSYPMGCIRPDLPVHNQLQELTQTHVHWVGDAIQPSHPLSSPSPPTFNVVQHQGLFKWVSSLHQVAKVLEFQLQHQSFQWIFRTDLL